MTKTKLAILLFCIAFGVNILAFVFSKKTYIIEEVKNVWLYELPPTASPLDSYPSANIGPQNGIIGTLFIPSHSDALETGLASHWVWDEKSLELRVTLHSGLTYSDETPITANDWVKSLEWAQSQMSTVKLTPEWAAFGEMKATATDPVNLILKWSRLPKDFDFERFARQVLTHPISGVFHPSNLTRLKAGEAIVKKWISSGPYTVRKWNPKEIHLASRDSFVIQLPKEFFRTLRFQSAPVKNPSCDFMQGNPQDTADKDLSEHSVVETQEEVHVFWICRSWNQPGRFCADPVLRAGLSQILAGQTAPALKGKVLEYRIPIGSDKFRDEFRLKLEERLHAAGAVPKEVSYFFKNSTDADVELGFVVVNAGPKSHEMAAQWLKQSSRLGARASAEPNVVGEIFTFPLRVFMKRIKSGDPFKKVFLIPDLEEKKLPL